jgi:hypothetical protein
MHAYQQHLDVFESRFQGNAAGHISSILLMTTYIVAMHNNSVLLLALGLPFDRALPWHKLLALAAIFNSLVHGLTFYVAHRADSMPDAYSSYHMAPLLSKAYGMEISGASTCFSSLANYCCLPRSQVVSLHIADWV